ncbi:glycoside hydrolase family 3 protein [Paenibacillus sp. FSL K6-2862]|uniref:glycoside hydrolase family 3 protein n=1 Tax=Paenibacillus sp. FSL K6-2862 TaxID=2921484 RepID=UPI0030FAF9E6
MNILSSRPFNLNQQQVHWVEQTLAKLSMEEKVGQLFVLPYGKEYQLDSEMVQRIKPGGFCVFGFEPEDTKESQHGLIQRFQSESEVPLLISGDLEIGGKGGTVDGTNLGTNMQIAAANDPQLSRAFGEAIDAEGSAMGFNWAFGPVVDINYNFQNPIVNTRAFGDSPDVVLRNAIPVIQGIQHSGNMAACVKHWPGDGMDDRCQHKALTVNSMSMEEWRSTFGEVYKQSFENGVKTVMSAHIALPAYYEELGVTDLRTKYTPGSLSYELNVKLLREELGFNGLIVSDATVMHGMQIWGKRSEIVPQCIASGVDMFLFTRETEYDFEAMIQGVRNGVISEERLNEAVTRILALKASLGLHQPGITTGDNNLSVVGSAEYQQLAIELAKKSVTLVKDTQQILPLSPAVQKKILLQVASEENSFFSTEGFNGAEFEEKLVREGFEVIREYELKETDNDVDVVIHLIKKSPGFLESTIRLGLQEMGGLMDWYPTRIPTIVISLGNPYILYEMPSVSTLINAYNATETVQEEIVNALIGKQPFLGASPVDAFCGMEWAKL